MRYAFLEGEKAHSVYVTKREKIDQYVTKVVVTSNDGAASNPYYFRRLAGELFLSNDLLSWRKTSSLPLGGKCVFYENTLDVFRGYIPSGKQDSGGGALKTQMPGKIVRVLVKEGQKVGLGEPLLILEAMKMENEIKSSKNGIIKKIYIKEGMNVDAGFLMIEIEE